MTTPIDLIRDSLLVSGIRLQDTIYADDIHVGFRHLNMMIPQWAQKRWIVYALDDISFVANGAISYSIGPGQNYDVVRPSNLEAAYCRLLNAGSAPNTVDYPLKVIEAREDYSQITLKNMSSLPSIVWYDSSYPIGQVFVWPIPNAGQYEIHLIVKTPLNQFTDLTTDIVLPPEYIDALMWNLASRLHSVYGLPPNPIVVSEAAKSLNVIRGANSQIGHLSLPGSILPGRMGRYSWHGIWPSGIY